MRSRRVLRYLNLAIGAALAVVLFLGYWWAWRPLARTSGTFPAPVGGVVTIARDRLGVPHIEAASLEDLLFAQGFVTAQDRLWQMDAMRRAASGDLAELFGAAALASDQETRRMRLRRIAEEHARALPPADRAAFAAYARGVNYFLETHAGRLPLEFTLLRYDPRPWSLADSLVISLQMFRTLTRSWRTELRKQNLLEGGDAAKVDFLFSIHAGGPEPPGSNAWVVSGRRTASGRPILANDPHLEWTFPSIWYLVHLKAPGLNAAGASLPGLPGVILGHNERIAWGITNLGFDVQDLFVERFDPQTGHYVEGGRKEPARLEREVILVRGSQRATVFNWITRRGPIFIAEQGRFLSLSWIAAQPGAFEYPFLEINRARNWQEFRAALARLAGPPLNFVYADVDGNIGYQVAGKLPIRRNYRGDVPADPAKATWDGYIPFEALPSVFNPPSGILVSANQNPFPENYPYPVNGRFAPPYRARRIREWLERGSRWRVPDMLRLQTDTYSPFAHFLARELVAAQARKKSRNPLVAEAVQLLAPWDGRMRRDAPQPMIAELAYRHLRTAVAERAAPGKGLLYDDLMAPAVLEVLLRERPAGWFADYDDVLLDTLADALEEGQRLQGRQMRRWQYGRYQMLRLTHPVLSRLPLVGRYAGIGAVPMEGSETTVLQVTAELGPSLRMVLDLADWDHSLVTLLSGQSGQFLSRHYKDQWRAFYEGRGLPHQFRRVEVKDVLRLTPER
ncbi:MAG: penicillin acylase family protein [Bryobacterales bacterium]|nr:penicillin acylase family protein [Bryobacteraceae bacterium]MDW8352935.1 penicillin acylase family protein [Bryobacterales bacterium]